MFLTLVIIFALAGAKHGSVSNFYPLFSHAPLLSILLVWQVVPWLVSGFESVGKYAEEANPNFEGRDFSVAILLTIFAGLTFFWVVIGAVSYVAPWQSLSSNQQFPTAVAFERALHAHWIVVLIMGSALVALVQAFNANMVASSRLLFAMSRRNLLNPSMSRVHPVNQTPSTAVISVGVATAVAIFLGEALLIPILEVGAVTAAVAWMAACASYYRMKPPWPRRAAAVFGLLVTSIMILVKVVPLVPGHFTSHEWIALAIWGALGAAIRTSRQRDPRQKPEMETASVES
jgi:amino acid transporter